MFKNGSLDGIGALITGGGGGMGGGAALWLARDGAAVTLMGRTRSTLEEARDRILTELDGQARIDLFVGDALDESAVEAAAASANDFGDGLGIAVATVGGGVIAPLLARTPEDLLEELQRNIVSTFLVVRHSVPHMTRRGGGSIVCVSSDASKMSWPYMAGYSAAKAGLDAMVRTMADELGHLGIRVNSVRPGLTETYSSNIGTLFSNEALLAEFVKEKPLGRTGVPDDIGAGIRYFAGLESSWVTGQSLAIEGGNELRKAPSLESVARGRLGDEVVDIANSGQIPT